MSYNVVFEFNEIAGGWYGQRITTTYESKLQFQISGYPEIQTVIARGVTDEESFDLRNLTPEICSLMGAIESAYQTQPQPERERVQYSIDMARIAIAHNRIHIQNHQLERDDASKYINFFNKIISDKPLSVKTAWMAALMITCRNNYGQVV